MEATLDDAKVAAQQELTVEEALDILELSLSELDVVGGGQAITMLG